MGRRGTNVTGAALEVAVLEGRASLVRVPAPVASVLGDGRAAGEIRRGAREEELDASYLSLPADALGPALQRAAYGTTGAAARRRAKDGGGAGTGAARERSAAPVAAPAAAFGRSAVCATARAARHRGQQPSPSPRAALPSRDELARVEAERALAEATRLRSWLASTCAPPASRPLPRGAVRELEKARMAKRKPLADELRRTAEELDGCVFGLVGLGPSRRVDLTRARLRLGPEPPGPAAPAKASKKAAPRRGRRAAGRRNHKPPLMSSLSRSGPVTELLNDARAALANSEELLPDGKSEIFERFLEQSAEPSVGVGSGTEGTAAGGGGGSATAAGGAQSGGRGDPAHRGDEVGGGGKYGGDSAAGVAGGGGSVGAQRGGAELGAGGFALPPLRPAELQEEDEMAGIEAPNPFGGDWSTREEQIAGALGHVSRSTVLGCKQMAYLDPVGPTLKSQKKPKKGRRAEAGGEDAEGSRAEAVKAAAGEAAAAASASVAAAATDAAAAASASVAAAASAATNATEVAAVAAMATVEKAEAGARAMLARVGIGR